MERYFQVTDQSGLYNEYMEYKNSEKVIHNLSDEFIETQGIVTDSFAYQGDTFYIVPTKNDLEKFGKTLCKPLTNGLRAFKSNSKVGKAWVKLLEDRQIVIKSKPYLGFCFNVYGHNRSRLFDTGDDVYCSFSSECDFDNTPESFVEMKASEFFKIVEDENERRKQNRESEA